MFGAMDLPAYRKQENLSQAQLAEILTSAGFRASQALISQWESGAVNIPAERCIQLEKVSGGVIKRAALRPDLFGALADDGEAA
jgi:DNA-binding transcriptional regulator YdaS (Cro superfamily)